MFCGFAITTTSFLASIPTGTASDRLASSAGISLSTLAGGSIFWQSRYSTPDTSLTAAVNSFFETSFLCSKSSPRWTNFPCCSCNAFFKSAAEICPRSQRTSPSRFLFISRFPSGGRTESAARIGGITEGGYLLLE